MFSHNASCLTPAGFRRSRSWDEEFRWFPHTSDSFGETKFIVMYSVFICYFWFWYYKMDARARGRPKRFLICAVIEKMPGYIGIIPQQASEHIKCRFVRTYAIEGENRKPFERDESRTQPDRNQSGVTYCFSGVPLDGSVSAVCPGQMWV